MNKPSICFVALSSYNLLSQNDEIKHIGGAEVQQWLMSQWLVEQGYNVSFITFDHGQPDGVVHNKIKIYKAYKKTAGLPLLRFVHPRWTKLYQALGRANADVYYQRGADAITGQVSLWCKAHGKPFIFAAASIVDCLYKTPLLTEKRESLLYKLGLRFADLRLAQTNEQQALLAKEFGLTSTISKNCGKAPSVSSLGENSSSTVLWVGRFVHQKRFDMLIELATISPDINFVVVGGSNLRSEYVSRLMEAASKLPNIKIYDNVPHSQMDDLYSRSKLLCCTSIIEGFPNTFLEAWRLGIPVLSTFDPDGVIASNGPGWVAGDVKGLRSKLLEVMDSMDLWRAASEAAKRYYSENHSIEVVMPKFEKQLLLLCK